MAVVSIKNKLRRGNLLVGNDTYYPSVYESIATVSVGSGGSSSITFSSIPSTYQHLQIRGITRGMWSIATEGGYKMRFNGDTGSSYTRHASATNPDNAGTKWEGSSSAETQFALGEHVEDNQSSGLFNGFICDVTDYANTNKYKTIRHIGGWDSNGRGYVWLVSGMWMSTSAVTSITIYDGNSVNLKQYSHFALYGIKGSY